MPVQIRNAGPNSVSLPSPLRGMLSPGASIIINATSAQVVALCPAIDIALKLTELPNYPGPFDAAYDPGVGSGIGGAVDGPASSTLNAVARYSDTSGMQLKNSGVTIDDSGNIVMGALKTVDGRDVSVDGTSLDAAVSTVATHTTSIAANTSKIGANTLVPYGTQGTVATDLSDAVNAMILRLPQSYGQEHRAASIAGSNVNYVGYPVATATGSIVARYPADTNWLSRRSRYGYQTASASAGLAAGLQLYASGPTGIHSRNMGFTFECGLGLATMSANSRWVAGLTATQFTTGDPATLTQCLVIGASVAGNVQVFHNDGGATAVAVDLGSNFPAQTNNACYSVWFGCDPGAATVYYRVRRLDVAYAAYGSFTTRIPAASSYMWPIIMINNNNADAVQVCLDHLGYSGFSPY